MLLDVPNVSPKILVSILPHAESASNHHREEALNLIGVWYYSATVAQSVSQNVQPSEI